MESEVSSEVKSELPELFYRNQFVLGVETPEAFGSWDKISIRDGLKLSAHPALDLLQVSEANRSLTCLGFLLDPRVPDATSDQILKKLFNDHHSFAGIIERSSMLGGRWILIYDDGRTINLLHDATGLRQVYYTFDSDSRGIWCASQPMVIADLLGLEIDSEAAEFLAFLDEYYTAHPTETRGLWWPGTGSQYREVKHLPPNHYLDLRNGTQYRFFPNKPLKRKTVTDAVQESAPLLRGMMQSTVNHFDELTLLVTAGLDSRLVLASAQPVVNDLEFLSIDYKRGSKDDISLPAAMLSGLGLAHQVTVAPQSPSADFRDLYSKHTVLTNDFYVANAEALLPFLQRERVAITGHNAEVFTNFYRLPSFAAMVRDLTPEMLTKLIKQMHNHPYAIKEIGKWMDSLGETYNYHPLDLAYWELRAGTWLAGWLSAYDLIWKDCVVLLNSREILNTMLSVDEKDRIKPNKTLHKELISELWPQVPLNLASEDYPARYRLKKSLVNIRQNIKTNVDFVLS